jgi:hypothetical protein
MARQVQLRRGTTAEHSTFTGAVGEVTVDTDKDVVVVHDGSTAGGVPLLKAGDLTAGSGISVIGTTIANTAPDQTVSLTGGTGISTSGTYPSFTVTNTAPDQTVVLTEGSNVTITGTYPNFTIASTDTNTTYTAGTGLVLAGTEFSVATTVVTSAYTGDVDITGELIVDSYNETYAAVTSTSNAVTVNCEAGNSFSHTLTENTTFTFSNPPTTGTSYAFTLKLVQDASASGYTVTWPASVDWPSATAPTLTATASAVDVFVFYTHDGGTTFYGFVAGQALG